MLASTQQTHLRTALKALHKLDFSAPLQPLSHDDRAASLQLLGYIQHALDRWRVATIHAPPVYTEDELNLANLINASRNRLSAAIAEPVRHLAIVAPATPAIAAGECP